MLAIRATHSSTSNSGIDVVHQRDRRFVLIYNLVRVGRTPIALAISTDGLHFTAFRTLESDRNAEFSYPALIQLHSGDLSFHSHLCPSSAQPQMILSSYENEPD